MKQGHSPGPDRQAGIYSYMDMVAKEAEDYALTHTSPMSPLLEELESFTLTKTPYPNMLTGKVEGRFLRLVTQLSRAHQVIEIGTFTGYSALAMAEALPEGGRIQTIDHDPEHARIAQAFFDRSPAGYRITIRLGEAVEILRTLPDAKTDLVFIDADKENYCAYYMESMRILRNGGLILADNALWYGRVFDPRDNESRAMAEFNELVNRDSRAEKLFLTIRDGIYLIRKSDGTV
ncbi:MAG: class I SAM-dependent methyltransferase [Candidatus Sulfobium sp.]